MQYIWRCLILVIGSLTNLYFFVYFCHRNEALRVAFIDVVETLKDGKVQTEYYSKLVKADINGKDKVFNCFCYSCWEFRIKQLFFYFLDVFLFFSLIFCLGKRFRWFIWFLTEEWEKVQGFISWNDVNPWNC